MTAPDIEALRRRFNEAFLARSRAGDDPLVSECHDAGVLAVAEMAIDSVKAAHVAGGQGPYKEARVARVAAEAEAKRLREALARIAARKGVPTDIEQMACRALGVGHVVPFGEVRAYDGPGNTAVIIDLRGLEPPPKDGPT